MIHYYLNPTTSELIAFDAEAKELTVLERVGEIKQITGASYL